MNRNIRLIFTIFTVILMNITSYSTCFIKIQATAASQTPQNTESRENYKKFLINRINELISNKELQWDRIIDNLYMTLENWETLLIHKEELYTSISLRIELTLNKLQTDEDITQIKKDLDDFNTSIQQGYNYMDEAIKFLNDAIYYTQEQNINEFVDVFISANENLTLANQSYNNATATFIDKIIPSLYSLLD